MEEKQLFEDIMNGIIFQAESVSTALTVEDKAKITKAGANAFAKGLEKVTKDKHYRIRKTGENPHLADSILVQNTNIDGIKDGNSTVGWDYTKSRVGHLIENGTRFPMYSKKGTKYRKGGQVAITSDPFVSTYRDSMEAQIAMFSAEAEVFSEIIKKKGAE